ncbi:MAG: FkbM family methyltransferase [Cyclobacteriaceae bacterium]|nr:FkbM family methyltransferase [Cyclobacteriaceae bacterium]
MNISLKVRIFNFFRNVFKIRFFETVLASLTLGKSSNHFTCKLVPNPYQYSSPTFRVVTRNSIFVRVDISDYIGHFLYFGFKDPNIDRLFQLCKDNFTVLDVGANIGWTVLGLSSIAKKGHVFGFEPDPYNYERCAENVGLNKFNNITIFPVGLGNKNTTLNLEIRTPSNRGGNRITDNGQITRPVNIVRLDDFPPIQDLSKVDLIKIDVEGYELNVLRGGERLLKKFKPLLFIELDDNNLKDQGDSARSLVEFLSTMGYRIENAATNEKLESNCNFDKCHCDIVAYHV